jgi:hypothetical protein
MISWETSKVLCSSSSVAWDGIADMTVQQETSKIVAGTCLDQIVTVFAIDVDVSSSNLISITIKFYSTMRMLSKSLHRITHGLNRRRSMFLSMERHLGRRIYYHRLKNL